MTIVEISNHPRETATDGGASRPKLNRRAVVDDALREKEILWWQRFARSEERFSWVLPEVFQPLPRERYMQRIADALGDPELVVDYGCGDGWISRALAKRMSSRFLGLDLSAAQIVLARDASRQFPRLDFRVVAGPEVIPSANTYILHGVLHHLPADEIFRLLERIKDVAPDGAALVVVEPVWFPGNSPDQTDKNLLSAMKHIVEEPARALRAQGRSPGPEVERFRRDAGERWWGEPPYGPSPMEKPFEHDELNAVLERYFAIEYTQPVQFLPASQDLATELALLAEDAPDLARAIQPQLQGPMDLLESALLKFSRLPDIGWYMTLTMARIGS